MAKNKGMTESALVSLLDRSIARAETEGEATSLRERALTYYNGGVSFPSEDGKSSVVSRDVADTINWLLPSLLRVFLSSEQVGIYEPRRQEFIEEMGPNGPARRDVSDERAAQATDYVNYVLMTESRGYEILRGAMWEGLLFGNGLIKHWWDHTEEFETEDFSGLDDDAFTQLVSDNDVEVLEHTQYDDPDWTPPPMPEPDQMLAMADDAVQQGVPPEALAQAAGQIAEAMQPAQRHDCRIKRKVSSGRLRIKALPHEEFFIGPDDLAIDEDETLLCGHTYLETRSDLIKSGYERDKVNDIPAFSSHGLDETKFIRTGTSSSPETDKATERVQINECYIRVDYDGDGVAEWRKVVIGGPAGSRMVLENEEWGDDLPFTDLAPDPMPHRWRGRSVFDETNDIQDIKTVLKRQTLDNLYASNNPQKLMRQGSIKNPDALLTQDLSEIVVADDINSSVRELTVPFTAQQSFGMLEYLDMVRETRTGVSRATTGLDLGVLQNQTATAVNAQQSAAYSKQEAMARNLAEGGMKRLFRCLLRLVVKHQDREKTVRLRGEWVMVDPRDWLTDMDVTINTGLGSGSRDRDLTILSSVMSEQKAIIAQAGPFNPICDVRKFRDTLAKMVEIAGLKSPERFFSEVTDEAFQQMQQQMQGSNQPDPKMMEAQAKLQMDQARMQADMQMKQAQMAADLQARQQEAEQRIQIDSQKMQMDFRMREMETEAKRQADIDRITKELAMRREQLQIEAQLRREQMQAEMQLKRELAMLTAQTQQDIAVSERVSGVQMGGELG